MENNRAPAGAKIDKTQTQVKLQFLSQSGQFKITNLAPQFKNARKSKLSVFQHFCIHQEQLCRIYDPLKQHVVDTGLIWHNTKCWGRKGQMSLVVQDIIWEFHQQRSKTKEIWFSTSLFENPKSVLVSRCAFKNKQQIVFCDKSCIDGWITSHLITSPEILSRLSFGPKSLFFRQNCPYTIFRQKKYINRLPINSFLDPKIH